MSRGGLGKPSREQLAAAAMEPSFPPTRSWVAYGVSAALLLGTVGYHLYWGIAAFAVLIALSVVAYRWTKSRGYSPPEVDWNAFALERDKSLSGALLWTVIPIASFYVPMHGLNFFRDSLIEPAPLWAILLSATIVGVVLPLCGRRAAQHDWALRRIFLAKLAEQPRPGE